MYACIGTCMYVYTHFIHTYIPAAKFRTEFQSPFATHRQESWEWCCRERRWRGARICVYMHVYEYVYACIWVYTCMHMRMYMHAYEYVYGIFWGITGAMLYIEWCCRERRWRRARICVHIHAYEYMYVIFPGIPGTMLCIDKWGAALICVCVCVGTCMRILLYVWRCDSIFIKTHLRVPPTAHTKLYYTYKWLLLDRIKNDSVHTWLVSFSIYITRSIVCTSVFLSIHN